MKTNFELGKLVIAGKEEKENFDISLDGIKISAEYSVEEVVEILKYDKAIILQIISLVKPLIDKVVKELK